MKRKLLIGTSLAVASFATAEARYVATTAAAFNESTRRADAHVIAVEALKSETTDGKVALKAGETPTTLLNKALSKEAGRKALAGILKTDDSDEASLQSVLGGLESKKKASALADFARALSRDTALRALVEEFRPAFLAQGSGAKKQGVTQTREEGPVQPVNPNNGTAVPVIVEESNYETLNKAVASAEKDLAQAITDEYHASRAAAEAAETVKRVLAEKDTASTNFETDTKAAADAATKATEAKTALTAAEKALEDAKAAESELTAQLPAAGAAIANPLAHNKLLADIKAREADIAIKQQAATDAATRLAEAEKASKEAADKAAASKTVHEDAVKAFTDAEAASKAAADKAAAAETAQAEADTKLANAIKTALEVATKEATKAEKEAAATRDAAAAAELKKTELQTAAQTAKDRVIDLGKKQTRLNSELTAARAADTANSTADTQAAVKDKEAAVVAIATELAKAKIDAKHAEQAANDAVKVAAKTADAAKQASEAKVNADSNLSAATEKAENNTYIKALKEEIVKKEESRLADEQAAAAAKDAADKEAAAKNAAAQADAAAVKRADAEKASKAAADKAAADKAAADKAAEIAAAVADALAKAKADAATDKAAAVAAAAAAAAKAAAAQAADKAAADAAAAAQAALALSTANAADVALKDAAAAKAAAAQAAETVAAAARQDAVDAKKAADDAAAKQVAAEQAVAAADAKRADAEKTADEAKQAAAASDAKRVAAEQQVVATQQAVTTSEAARKAAEQAATAAKAEKDAADKRANDAEQQLNEAKQALNAEAAQNAESARGLKTQLSLAYSENDRLHARLESARNQIFTLQSQINELTDEAEVYNPDKVFAELIAGFEADLEAAQTAKAAADAVIGTLRSEIIFDGRTLDDARLTLTEVREIASANDHNNLVEAIDAYFESSLAVDTSQRVLESAKNLQGLSEVEGIEGKLSDAVARIINADVAHKKVNVLEGLLNPVQATGTILVEAAEGFKKLSEIVGIFNAVQHLIDEDVSETESEETSLNGEGVREPEAEGASGTDAEDAGETEIEVVREADAAAASWEHQAKSERDRLIAQLQKIVKGSGVDTKTLNDALALVSATKERFEGTLKQVRVFNDPFAGLFSNLECLEEHLKSAISNGDGHYRSVYKLLNAISVADEHIQTAKEIDQLHQDLSAIRGKIDGARITYVALTNPSAEQYQAHFGEIVEFEDREKEIERNIEEAITEYNHYTHVGEEEAPASSVQNFTADSLRALKLALAQYNDYLNSIIQSSDGDMLPENDQANYAKIISEFDLRSVYIRENADTLREEYRVLASSVDQKRIDAHAISAEKDSLLHNSEVNAAVYLVSTANELQKLEAKLEAKRTEANQDRETELRNIAHNNDRSNEERNNASEALQELENIKKDITRLEADIAQLTATAADVKDSAKLDAAKEKAKEYFDLEDQHYLLDNEFREGHNNLNRLHDAFRWLDKASYNVDRKRSEMLLGGKELVASITTAITAILNPVAAAEVDMHREGRHMHREGPFEGRSDHSFFAWRTEGTSGDLLTDVAGKLLPPPPSSLFTSDDAATHGTKTEGTFQPGLGGDSTLTSSVGFGTSSVDTTQVPPQPADVTSTPSDQSGDDADQTVDPAPAPASALPVPPSAPPAAVVTTDTTQAPPPPPPVAPAAAPARKSPNSVAARINAENDDIAAAFL